MTTGASNDIERATELARNMVTKWGLSDKLGPLTYTEETGEVFLGRSVTQHKQVSDGTAHAIDEEVRRVIEINYTRAKEILDSNLDKLHAMAAALVKYETIDESQLKDIMEGRPPKPPERLGRQPVQPSTQGAPGRRAARRRRLPRVSAQGERQRGLAPYLQCGAKRLELSRPLVMGVLNVTPDSFSDGGRFLDPAAACEQARRMLGRGCGAHRHRRRVDASRSGTPCRCSEELRRVLPVIERARTHRQP